MGKFDKDFVLLDESVVDYGYRCIMSGAQLSEFIANPIMLIMHLRAAGNYYENPDTDLVLPIGRWVDIRIEGSRLLAKPEFDDDDELAIKVEGKVKKGYLNAASVWVDPIAVSDDDNLKIPGQNGPTITQWGIRESSIVDIPGCRNAIVIRDESGKLMKLNSTDKRSQGDVLNYLNSLLPQKNTLMDKKVLAAKLGLPETASDVDIDAKLTATLAASAPNTLLAGENQTLKKKVEDLEAAQVTKRNEDLVDGAITATKLTAGDRETYLKLATADFETTKKVIDGMKPYESIEGKLTGDNTSANKLEVDELMKQTGRELYLSGKLERLKVLSIEHFKLKYKEAYGVDFKGKAN